MSYTLPRDIKYELNAFENGWLRGALSEEIMKRMEKECPAMYLQFQIGFTQVYAKSDGHPYQLQAIQDLAKYKTQLILLLEKEKK